MEIRKAKKSADEDTTDKRAECQGENRSIKLVGVQSAKSATREIDERQEILNATMTAYVISKPIRATAKLGKKGKYRIGKEITDFRDDGDYDTAIYYAEFEMAE